MARRASRRRDYAVWTMRAMAAEAAGSKLSVRRFAFLGVTAGALCLFARARVRLMAADAGLVSERGRGRLTLVTALARLGDSAAVRFVAADAILMASVCVSMRVGVAAGTGNLTDGRVVREPVVAALASGVARAHGGQREL